MSEPELFEPPSEWQLVKRFLSRVYARYGTLIIVCANVAVTASGILLYDALKPRPQKLTQRDIDTLKDLIARGAVRER